MTEFVKFKDFENKFDSENWVEWVKSNEEENWSENENSSVLTWIHCKVILSK